MKRLLILSILLLGVVFGIRADEKEDSLNYYVQRISIAYEYGDYQDACLSFENTLRLYKELAGDVSQDTVYASLEDSFANLCFQLGDYETAARLLTDMSNIYKVYGSNNLQYVTNSLAICYDHLGNYEKAIEIGTQALEIYKRTLGEEHPDYALSLNNLALYYSHHSNYEKAIELGTQALEISKKALGEEHPNYATSLNSLAICYDHLGNYEKAIEIGTQALEIRKRTLGEEHPDYASSLHNLTRCYSELGDYAKAIELGTKALEILKRTFGEEHPDYASSLDILSYCYLGLGEYEKAIEFGTQALEIYKKTLGEEHPIYASSLINLADYYSDMGDYTKAIEFGTQTLEIHKRTLGEEHPNYATSLNRLAYYYSNMGDYAKAIELGTQAMDISKRTSGEEHPGYASSLNNLAIYYCYLGDYTKAIEFGAKALEIYKRTLGEEHPTYASSLNNLASYCSSLGDYAKAIELGTQAAELFKRTLGEEHPEYATSLGNLANYYSEFGDYEKAIELGTRALEIRKRTLGEEHPYYATSLTVLAYCFSEFGDYAKAIELGMHALEIRKRTLGEEHPTYASSLNNLSYCYSALGDYDKTILLLEKYIPIVRKNVLNNFSGLTTNERLMYWGQYSSQLNQFIPSFLVHINLPKTSMMLYDYTALFAKGLLLSTELEMTKQIQESGDNEALQLYSEFRKNRQILNAQYSKPIAERHINCDSLERVSNDLERQLVTRVKAFGDYTRNLSITWQDVQSKLNDNDIAIEFLSYPKKDGAMHYAALTLCKNDTAPMLTPLFVESKLLEASEQSDTYQTAEADSLVWGPLSSRLEGKAHVYFSASGMLHNIGIEYLPCMDGKDCYRLSSTRELVTHTSNETLRSATLYGDIDYDATYAAIESKTPSAIKYYAMNMTGQHRGVFDDRSLDDGVDALPGTRAELNEVSALMKQLGLSCDTVTGVQASEESFKALSGQRRSLLHISTHGFYYNDKKANKLKPHLRQMLMGDDRPAYAEDRSLLRCGLCFAGANQTLLGKSQPSEWQGDGILNALEIAQTDLRGLDLVVLSACQTALGDIAQGEGVFGLQRGFKKAGAKTLLMSLWKVNDVATKILMVEFYKNYLAGEGKLESLRKAQQYVRDYTDEKGEKLFDDPHYWAGFILLDAFD